MTADDGGHLFSTIAFNRLASGTDDDKDEADGSPVFIMATRLRSRTH